VNVKRSRVLGFIVIAAGVAAVWLGTAFSNRSSSTAIAYHGGQLIGSIRSEPRSFNRLVKRDHTTELLNMLMQGSLVRINRATFDLEPWLAEKWESGADGRQYTLHLRRDVTWSDGAPFTSADVLFSVQAVFDPKVESVLASVLTLGGERIRIAALDTHTVVVTFARSAGPGLRLLDSLPILPRHKLEPALLAGTLASAWDPRTPPAEIVGTGPFVLRDYQPGQRVVLDRNPRYWRKAADGHPLPYLDRIVLEIVSDQNAELLRLQSGAIDLAGSELRSEDLLPIRRAQESGTVKLLELGIGTDADAFWFCLKPEVKRNDPRFVFVQKPEFRKAISHAVDRDEFARSVFLGEAVPIWGPVTPGNTRWFSTDIPQYPHDLARARELLKSIGLEDRNGNGVVEDVHGTEARFTVITQRGLGWSERGTMVLREQAAKIGVALDIAPLEFGAMIQRLLECDYDAIYMRPLFTDLDPAGNMDMWLSSGSAHFWNPTQEAPATEWEQQVDTLMRDQSTTPDPQRRRQIFNEVQRLFAENVPVLYFAAPRLYAAHSSRLVGITPSVLRPAVLWSADTIRADTAPVAKR
jgi:peptide/nickel transport system substrate-binding protein